jgi:hypothetical protein
VNLGRYLIRGVIKDHRLCVLNGPYQKKNSNFDKTIDKKNRCQFFLNVCFIKFLGVFLAIRVRMYYKKLQKNRSENKLRKNRQHNTKSTLNRFYIDFINHIVSAFLGEGSLKTPLKHIKNVFDPGPFLASDPPTHHGGPQFLFPSHLLVFGTSLAGHLNTHTQRQGLWTCHRMWAPAAG